MKRRDFTACTAGSIAGTFLPPLAHAHTPQEGGPLFRTLDQRVAVDTPAGKIEVIEFFWYSCPACNAFEPKLVAWSKRQPPDVVLKRVPVAFRDEFVPQQRLYYALETLGKLEALHGKVFEAVHVQKQPTNTQDLILTWAEKQGLDRAKFLELFNSFSVAVKVRRAAQLQNAFAAEGVPSLGVAGRFYTDGHSAGNMDKALQVVDLLVAEIRQGK